RGQSKSFGSSFGVDGANKGWQFERDPSPDFRRQFFFCAQRNHPLAQFSERHCFSSRSARPAAGSHGKYPLMLMITPALVAPAFTDFERFTQTGSSVVRLKLRGNASCQCRTNGGPTPNRG